jgi:hypothetical protein
VTRKDALFVYKLNSQTLGYTQLTQTAIFCQEMRRFTGLHARVCKER